MTTVSCNEPEDGILEVCLNRPDRLNAINPALIAELIEVFRGLQRDRQVRVVILTGAGKGFCSGADLQEFVAPGGIPGTAGMSQLGFVYKFQEYLADLMLTGRIIDAVEAREIRLVSRVVRPADLASTAMDAARSIRENSEYGVWMTKKGLWTNVDAPSLRHAMELENRTQVRGSCSGCVEESMQAFVEGRKPSWKPL